MCWEIKLNLDECPYRKKLKHKYYSLEEYKKRKVVPTRLNYGDYYLSHSKKKYTCSHIKNKTHVCNSNNCPIKVKK